MGLGRVNNEAMRFVSSFPGVDLLIQSLLCYIFSMNITHISEICLDLKIFFWASCYIKKDRSGKICK